MAKSLSAAYPSKKNQKSKKPTLQQKWEKATLGALTKGLFVNALPVHCCSANEELDLVLK